MMILKQPVIGFRKKTGVTCPIGSMGLVYLTLFKYICLIIMVNVGKYTVPYLDPMGFLPFRKAVQLNQPTVRDFQANAPRRYVSLVSRKGTEVLDDLQVGCEKVGCFRFGVLGCSHWDVHGT